MKTTMMTQRSMPNGDLLSYYLLADDSSHGLRIELERDGATADRRDTPLCFCEKAAKTLLSVFSEYDVYPSHLFEILRDFDERF